MAESQQRAVPAQALQRAARAGHRRLRAPAPLVSLRAPLPAPLHEAATASRVHDGMRLDLSRSLVLRIPRAAAPATAELDHVAQLLPRARRRWSQRT
jgi:hypothetical protein